MTVTVDDAAATRTAARRGAVRTVLNTVEWVIFRGGDGLAVARNNAWAAVQEDRARAKARAEASTALLDPQVDTHV